jgi:hypothetical protein
MTFVEKILPQEIQNEELVYSEFILLISLWCRVLMFREIPGAKECR